MNVKARWLTAGLVVCIFVMGVQLHSQEAEDIPRPKPEPALQQETEEAVLQEKAEALEFQYNRLVAADKAGAFVPLPAHIQRAGCDWQLAAAELAAFRGQGQEQIRHLERAVEFAKNVVEIELQRQEAGLDFDATGAIIRRADVKLALIRAKKQQTTR